MLHMNHALSRHPGYEEVLHRPVLRIASHTNPVETDLNKMALDRKAQKGNPSTRHVWATRIHVPTATNMTLGEPCLIGPGWCLIGEAINSTSYH